MIGNRIKWKLLFSPDEALLLNSKWFSEMVVCGKKILLTKTCNKLISLFSWKKDRSSRPEVFYKKVFLKIWQNSQENTCARVSLLIKNIKKETLAQVLSCEFCEFSRTFFFIEHLRRLLLKRRQNHNHNSIITQRRTGKSKGLIIWRISPRD